MKKIAILTGLLLLAGIFISCGGGDGTHVCSLCSGHGKCTWCLGSGTYDGTGTGKYSTYPRSLVQVLARNAKV